MKSYRPNRDEAVIAFKVAKIRNGKNRGQTNMPKGEHSTCEQREIQHYRAALAEIAVSRMTNLCWTGLGKGSLGYIDVGNMLEVRSIDDLQKGLLVRDRDKESLPYVLVHVADTRLCTFMGWAFFEEVKELGRIIDADTSKPAYILSKEKLHDMESLIMYTKKTEHK